MFWRSPANFLKSDSAENLDESFRVAKRFLFGKNWGGDFDEKKIEKVAYKKHRSLKKKSDIACWAWENLILRQKVLLLINLTRPKIVKGGFFQIF